MDALNNYMCIKMITVLLLGPSIYFILIEAQCDKTRQKPVINKLINIFLMHLTPELKV